MPKRRQPGHYPTAQVRAAAEVRRYETLELYKSGMTEVQIAEKLSVSKALVHKDIKRVLGDLAQKYSGMADAIRALQMDRYSTLLSRWWPQALNGDAEATRMVMSIMHRISEINGVIPKEPLITIDQRSIHLTQGEVTFSIEAAHDNTNGNSSEHLLSQTRVIPETGIGDIQS
jgi:hypothetical protein